MKPLLASKLALITGAGAGIGAASAELYASEGAAVLVVDIDGNASEDVAKHIVADGGTATALTVDVRDSTQVEQMRARVLKQHGPVDILVNNVGHWVHLPPSFAEGSPDHWQALYEVNLLHVLQVTHAFLPSML